MFTTSSKILINGTITVVLPDFGQNQETATQLMVDHQSIYISNSVEMSYRNGSELRFVVVSEIPAGTAIVLNMSDSISLPPSGVEANSSDLTVAIHTQSGSVAATPFISSPGSGVFIRKPYLIFDSPRAGYPSVTTITFKWELTTEA